MMNTQLSLRVFCSFAIFGGCHLFAAEPVTLWDPAVPLPTRAAAPVLDDVAFHVIKKQRPDVDGCNWTLGVSLVWHKDKLYASYGFNQGGENTASEEAHVRCQPRCVPLARWTVVGLHGRFLRRVSEDPHASLRAR